MPITTPGSPLGDGHHVGRRERADAGEALELGADAGALLGAERDRHRVGHPLGVRLDVLHRGPHRVGRHADRRAEADLDASSARAASRSCAAACSGGTMFTRMPVPSSKPGDDARCAGSTSTYQWNSPAGASRRRGAHDHVVGDVAEQRVRARRARRAARRATTPTSASVASSKRARVERWATRIPYGRPDGERAPRRRRAVDHHEPVAAARRRARARRGRCGRTRSGRAPASTAGGTRSSATSCACGMGDRRAGGLALVHEHLHVRVAGGEVVRAPGRG